MNGVDVELTGPVYADGVETDVRRVRVLDDEDPDFPTGIQVFVEGCEVGGRRVTVILDFDDRDLAEAIVAVRRERRRAINQDDSPTAPIDEALSRTGP